jgi:hypothetical protein
MHAITVSRGNLYIGERSKIDVFALSISWLFALVSTFGVNKYVYGVEDQVITIPFIKSLVDPTLYPNDPLIAQQPYFYTYLWKAVAWIVSLLHIEIAPLFLTLYLLAMVLAFYGFYLIVVALFKRRDVAILSLFLLLFNRFSLALSLTIDPMFLTRSAVLPLLIFALYFFLKERFILSYALLGVGFLIHPLTTIYAGALIGVASLVHLQRIGWKRLVVGGVVFLVIASPIFIWKAHYHPGSLSTFYADPRWLALMRLRSAHHVFPFSWGIKNFIEIFAIMAAFVVSWKHRPGAFHHRAVLSFVGAILMMWVIGTVFTELLPLSIVIQIQLFRSTTFLIYFALMYIANYVVMELRTQRLGLHTAVAGVLVIVALYDVDHSKMAMLPLLALLALVVLYQQVRRRVLPSQELTLMIAGLALAVGVVLALQRPHVSIANTQNDQWLDVQRWAKRSTNVADVFIVPPDTNGFRVESERAIYGDWKDGTQMFFNPEFGYQWFERMQKLGYTGPDTLVEDYKRVDQAAFTDIARGARNQQHAVYVIMYTDRTLTFPEVYHNKSFAVYQVTP